MKREQIALLVAGGLAIAAGVFSVCALVIGWDAESSNPDAVIRQSELGEGLPESSIRIRSGDELTTGMVITTDDRFEISGYLGSLSVIDANSISVQGVPRGSWQEEKLVLGCTDSKDYEALSGKLVLVEYNKKSEKLEKLQVLDSTQLVHGRVISVKLGDSDEVIVSLTGGTNRTLSLGENYYCEGIPSIASDVLGYFAISANDELLMFIAA